MFLAFRWKAKLPSFNGTHYKGSNPSFLVSFQKIPTFSSRPAGTSFPELRSTRRGVTKGETKGMTTVPAPALTPTPGPQTEPEPTRTTREALGRQQEPAAGLEDPLHNMGPNQV